MVVIARAQCSEVTRRAMLRDIDGVEAARRSGGWQKEKEWEWEWEWE